MDYFPHDTNALSDDKLLALRLAHGGEAVFCYWSLLEKIYADEAPVNLSATNVEATSVLYRLGVGSDVLQEYVSTMVLLGLFERDGERPDCITSARAMDYIAAMDKKRETARQNGKNHKPKPRRKPKPNQGGTDVGSNAEPNSVAYKTLNGIGSDKPNQIPGDGGCSAGGGGPAPQPPGCPACGTPMQPTNAFKPNTSERFWRCPACREELAVPEGGAS